MSKFNQKFIARERKVLVSNQIEMLNVVNSIIYYLHDLFSSSQSHTLFFSLLRNGREKILGAVLVQ